MSRIDEMIKELCPEGVEMVKLSSLCSSICTGLNPRTNFKLNEEGAELKYVTVKEIATNKIVFSDSTDKISERSKEIINKRSRLEKGDILFSGIGTIGKVVYVDIETENWDCSESVFLLKPNEHVYGKYLSYTLVSKYVVSQYESCAAGAIMKGVRKATLENLEIPLPPLSIQQEIVSVLDSFTTLIDKMKQEVEKRKKQMEYYREKLLTFEEGECEWKTLKQVAEIGTGSGNTNEGLEEGRYPFYTRGQEILRKNTFEYDEEAIVTAGDGVGVGKVMHYVKGKYALHQRAYRFKPNEGLSTKYLYYYMQVTFYKYVCGNAVASSVSSLRKPKLQVYPVPVPPLPKQSSIVTTLDKFESYISKLEQMIELRQKQYEYYRERLLTF